MAVVVGHLLLPVEAVAVVAVPAVEIQLAQEVMQLPILVVAVVDLEKTIQLKQKQELV